MKYIAIVILVAAVGAFLAGLFFGAVELTSSFTGLKG